MRYAVILAGGSGTRLWPASRRARPKQLLALAPGDTTLVAAAVARGRALAGADRVLIVTAAEQVEATRAACPNVEILAEPVGRNTAAAIALAAATLARRDPAAALAVLPADQHVVDDAGLVGALAIALAAAEASDAIGTIGIRPTRAETGFGYLERGDALGDGVYAVVRFVEKPDRETAERYVASGRYLWNAGMFAATAARLLAELDAHLPATAEAARAIAADPTVAAARYGALANISIDHAVMERAARVVTVPVDVGWDDVGSWAALPALRGADPDGNTVEHGLVIDGRGNILASDDGTLIATVGVSDLVVVKHGDAILVIPRERAQDVRKVVEALSARGLARYL